MSVHKFMRVLRERKPTLLWRTFVSWISLLLRNCSAVHQQDLIGQHASKHTKTGRRPYLTRRCISYSFTVILVISMGKRNQCTTEKNYHYYWPNEGGEIFFRRHPKMKMLSLINADLFVNFARYYVFFHHINPRTRKARMWAIRSSSPGMRTSRVLSSW